MPRAIARSSISGRSAQCEVSDRWRHSWARGSSHDRTRHVSARDVITNLRELASRTSDAQGAQRVAWGPVWRDARRWLDGLLAEEGLHPEPDVAGNRWITVPGAPPDT